MEKNTVCMDLYEYQNLLLANHDMQKELWELKSETIPSFKEEVCDLLDRISQLEKAISIVAIDKFNIESFRLEQLLDLDNEITSGVCGNKKHLNDIGISDECIIDAITEVKNKFDEEKENKE